MVRVLTPEQSIARVRALMARGCKVSYVETPDGTVILKKCPPTKKRKTMKRRRRR